MDHLDQQFLNTVSEAVLNSGLSGATITVAVSGGPDSLSLLDALHKTSSHTKIQLNVAHLNHKLRHRAAKTDSDFVQSFCQSIGVPCVVGTIDVLKMATDRKVSIEEAARQARHIFLSQSSVQFGSAAVALGHTSDDQAETILMHLIRGSGLKGLRGMDQISTRIIDQVSLQLFRPLLSISRTDVERYCLRSRLSPRIDTTNFSKEFTRNAIRLELIPSLQKYNPEIKKTLLRLSRTVSQDLDFLEDAAKEVHNSISLPVKHGIALDTKALGELPESLASRILKASATKVNGSGSDITLSHIESMMNLVHGSAGRSVNLPHGLIVTRGYGKLFLHKSHDDITPLPLLPTQPTALLIPGVLELTGWKVETAMEKAPKSYPNPEKNSGGIAWLKISPNDTLFIRSRKPGDLFQPSGMRNHKKLQDFMVDARIPRLWRDRTPLLMIKGEIAWVVGWRTAEWASAESGTLSIKVEFTRTKR